jgi:hypothetical protein
MTVKFAIFAAVSTKTQAAADKISLPAQVERCRQAGQGHGWSESAGPFIAPGQSRTRRGAGNLFQRGCHQRPAHGGDVFRVRALGSY